MIEKWKIGNIMDLLIEDCDECPLERICDGDICSDSCSCVWEKFFNSKVKEGGVEKPNETQEN